MEEMKYIVLFATLIIAFAVVVNATSDCSAAASEPTLEYEKCVLIKPVEAVQGDEITINCTHIDNVKKIKTPLKGTRVSITGYNEDYEAIEGMSVTTQKDGTYSFTANVIGQYMIQVSSCDYTSYFEVAENPLLNTGIVTGAVVADPEPDPEPEPEPEPIVVEEPPEARPLGFIINGTESEEDKKEVSNFMLMLVGFLIS